MAPAVIFHRPGMRGASGAWGPRRRWQDRSRWPPAPMVPIAFSSPGIRPPRSGFVSVPALHRPSPALRAPSPGGRGGSRRIAARRLPDLRKAGPEIADARGRSLGVRSGPSLRRRPDRPDYASGGWNRRRAISGPPASGLRTRAVLLCEKPHGYFQAGPARFARSRRSAIPHRHDRGADGPMRVTIVTETYAPQVNGVSRTLGHLVRYLAELGRRRPGHPPRLRRAGRSRGRARRRPSRPIGRPAVLQGAASTPAPVRQGEACVR